jgi:RNA polymerase-associated protein RTF1
MDMEMSDDEDEEGQINRFDLDDDKDKRSFDRSKSNDGPIAVEDLMKAQLTRDVIARLWGRPYFDKVLQGKYCGQDVQSGLISPVI